MSEANPPFFQAPAAAVAPAPDDPEDPLKFKEVKNAEDEKLGGGNIQRAALCISGGGIRSATFALGAIQGLADLGIVEHFDYLSTVSGGGYIGSWLTAWKNHRGGLEKIIPELESSAPPAAKGQLDPIQHLREYSNYLSPQLGFFSADTWTLVATVARNMLLNWLVFIPLLMFALMLPRIVLALARLGETYNTWYVQSAVSWFPSLEHKFLPALSGIFFAVGVFNVLRYLPSVGGENHNQNQFLKNCFLPVFLAALAFLTLDAWFTGADATHPGKTLATTLKFWSLFAWIAVSGLAGYVAYAIVYWKKVKEKLHELEARQRVRNWPRLKWVSGLLAAATITNLSTAAGAWLLVSEAFGHLSWPVYVTISMPLLLLSFALAVAVYVGFTSLVFGDEDREWLARAGAWGLLFTICWAGFAALALITPRILFDSHAQIKVWLDSALAAAGGIGGILAALAGLSSKTKAQAKKDGSKDDKAGLLEIAGQLAAPIFIVVFLTLLAVLTNWILWKAGAVDGDWKAHKHVLDHTRTEDAVLLAVLFLSFSWLMARFIDINKFSLHAMYRNRLIRAYPGASNPNPVKHEFTGFSVTDNPLMSEIKPELKPFHVVNVALNLLEGKRLAWQQRRAESFTISPLHCGYGDSSDQGDSFYRPTKYYGGEGGLSLGTAMALSGAAASPNMGYHSSPALTFIMTLFNARLGAWLGNPKQVKWQDEGPRSAFDSIVREAFGLTNDESPYVYLSDGGHFENLALYEMVRRHCRYIIVLDGAADADFAYEDLGNALRKIRIDFKISIDFEPSFLEQLNKSADGSLSKQPRSRCAVAEIRYHDLDPSLENGALIYIKPVVLGNEPPDVIAYKTAYTDFPHQSTADQFFDESQTESYRMLGLWTITDIFHTWDKNSKFQAALDHAEEHVSQKDHAKRAADATGRRKALAEVKAKQRAAAKAAAKTAGA